MPYPSPGSLVLFYLCVAFCLGWGVWASMRTARPRNRFRDGAIAAAALAAWVVATSLPVGTGAVTVANAFPAGPLQFVVMVTASLALVLSPLGKRLSTVPLWALFLFQGMRFPLELALHMWADQGVAPPQMTWTGSNPDIVAGLLSLALAPFSHIRWVAWTAFGAGALLLANVLRVVFTSIPGSPILRYDDPIELAFHLVTLPIATVCVVGAVTVYGVTLRRLLARDG